LPVEHFTDIDLGTDERTFKEIDSAAAKAKIVYLPDFDLRKLEEYFHYATFERRLSKKKSHKIAHAMLENKFLDNVLRVTEFTGSEKYDVIDGQHRIDGLIYSRETFGLQTYDLILFIYSEEGKREIYRKLNLGTPLTLGQHLKATDNGRVKFFIDLRRYCEHYTKGSKITFSTAINWIFYAKSTLIQPLRPLTVDEFLPTITTKDNDQIKKFIEHQKYHKSLENKNYSWLGFDVSQSSGKFSGRDGKRI